MKNLFSILIVSLIVLPNLIFAGTSRGGGMVEIGNGGGACVCRNANNEITESSLADFALMRAHDIPIRKSSLKYQEILNEIFGKDLKPLSYIIENSMPKEIIYVPPKVKLERIYDNIMQACPEKDAQGNSCKYEQLANFSDEDSLYISSEIFKSDKLSEMDKAGLMAHEHFYFFDRIVNKTKTSEHAKNFLSLVFNENFNKKEIYKFANNRFKAIDFAIVRDDADLIKELNNAQIDLTLERIEKEGYLEKILFYRAVNVLNEIMIINERKKLSDNKQGFLLNSLYFIIPSSTTPKFDNLIINLIEATDKSNFENRSFYIPPFLVDYGSTDLIKQFINNNNSRAFYYNDFFLKLNKFYREYTADDLMIKLYPAKVATGKNFNYLSLRKIKFQMQNLDSYAVALLNNDSEIFELITKISPPWEHTLGTLRMDLNNHCMIALFHKYVYNFSKLNCKIINN